MLKYSWLRHDNVFANFVRRLKEQSLKKISGELQCPFVNLIKLLTYGYFWPWTRYVGKSSTHIWAYRHFISVLGFIPWSWKNTCGEKKAQMEVIFMAFQIKDKKTFRSLPQPSSRKQLKPASVCGCQPRGWFSKLAFSAHLTLLVCLSKLTPE